MDGDEGDNAAIRVAAGHDGEDGEQQHVGQLVESPLRPGLFNAAEWAVLSLPCRQ